ncbi:MAG: UV DNA damage repair endonuclease UvsE [Candidatus Micrarchaeota archaeon]|nr:UV DNA damage repair endonuclease UvsE [Candidatus Micrarchaeota archaeon]
MKIGYPCINTSIGCTANSTFRLANYSEEKMREKIGNNLNCLKRILEFNLKHGLLFFRISSDLIPFASHPICKFNWQNFYKKEFNEIGKFIKENNFRISMHPDQFVILNSPNEDTVRNSIKELDYHCQVLDLMGLGEDAKVQIHVGGRYKNKEEAKQMFVERYLGLPNSIKKRLVIENDERIYSLRDCMEIYEETGVPVLFDSFHHECLNNGESRREALAIASESWDDKDGIIMTDYSSGKGGKRKGSHSEHINIKHFKNYIKETKGLDFDIMLEIKDKEKSALKAIEILKSEILII